MITLTEFLSRYVKYDKYDMFPSKPIFYDVINYFKYNNFKIVHNKNIENDPDYYLEINMKDTKVPVCVYDDKLAVKDLCWVRIRNVGEINKNNPLLFFYVTLDKSCKDEYDVINLANKMQANYIGIDLTSMKKYYTWEDFKKVFYEVFKNSLN